MWSGRGWGSGENTTGVSLAMRIAKVLETSPEFGLGSTSLPFPLHSFKLGCYSELVTESHVIVLGAERQLAAHLPFIHKELRLVAPLLKALPTVSSLSWRRLLQALERA